MLASLAAVQATVFLGRGLCLGISVHQAACDDDAAGTERTVMSGMTDGD